MSDEHETPTASDDTGVEAAGVATIESETAPEATPTPEPVPEVTPAMIAATQPKKKWHDSKWKLIVVVAFVSWIIGMAMALPDREAAKKEGDKIVASAKSERAEIVGEAEDKREELLGDIDSQRKEIEGDVKTLTATSARLTKQKATIAGQVNQLKRELGKLNREKAMGTFEGDGIYVVGDDIMAGTYKATASPGCYYAVLKDLNGSIGSIQTNGNVDGPVVINVPSSAAAVEVQGCGTFTKSG